MPYVKHPIGALIEDNPARAIDKIMAAYKKAGCVQRDAAKLLKADEGTIIRWVLKLQLGPAMAAMADQAKREGWFGSGRRIGRPPSRSSSRRGQRKST